MIAAFESKQTVIHLGSFIAFIILFIKLLFAFHATLGSLLAEYICSIFEARTCIRKAVDVIGSIYL